MAVPLALVRSAKATFDSYRPPALVAQHEADERLVLDDVVLQRILTFVVEEIALSILLVRRGASRTVDILVRPAVEGSVCLEHHDDQAAFTPLVDGRATVDCGRQAAGRTGLALTEGTDGADVAPGPVRLTLRSLELGRPVRTGSMHL